MTYTFKRVSKEDFNDWASMRHCLWPSSTDKHLSEIRNLSKDNQYIAFIAKNENGEKVGFLEAGVRRYANGCTKQPVLFLEGIWVAELERRNGIAFMLINQLEQWAKKNKFSEICSDCDIDNNISIMGHEAWGFKETERVIYFRKDLNEV